MTDQVSLESIIRSSAQLLEQADLFFGHGTDNAIDEAAWLVLHAMGHSPAEPVEDYQALLNDEQVAAVNALIQRRITERKPAAYLTNQAWFAGLPFYVDERVLVPRSPLAELIHEGLVPWVEPDEVTHVLDMCTGSGCIAIACAYAFENAHVDGVDLSTDALDVARINIAEHQLTQRVTAIESDLFTALPVQRYQVIISNPPYVDASDMSALTDEFKAEPEMGLAAGDDGLFIVNQMLRQAADYLTDDGILIVEVGNSAEALENAWPEMDFGWFEFAAGGMGVFILTRDELLAGLSKRDQ